MQHVRIALVHSIFATTAIRHTLNTCRRTSPSIMAGADIKPKRSSSTTVKSESKPFHSSDKTIDSTATDEKPKPSKVKKPKLDVARAAAKTDGKAKALGVGGLASLLQASSPEASSSRTPVEKPKKTSKKTEGSKTKSKDVKKSKGKEQEVEEGDENVEQDRGMMLQWASQAIATSKTGISLEEIKEEELEAKKEKVAKKQTQTGSVDQGQKAVGASAAKDFTRSNDRQGKASTIRPVPGDDALTVIDLPAEKDTALRRELRDMVSGLTKYERESQKVPGN
ncbi:hypothetical protein HD553DRAFT_40774 [Filobasidium floriforme]|uniref:uncharacterized protein n=1 Tax=Filobasidium floriforme TaxID=5210 RepID=UPI001E8DD270|nr:uncharacterized protein HD553DRAFT_40774 [Filobasidium floriforme]KAH8084117.1 hypothetical protein HD553DRAFT_40774 [Filobasidium floriforme]